MNLPEPTNQIPNPASSRPLLLSRGKQFFRRSTFAAVALFAAAVPAWAVTGSYVIGIQLSGRSLEVSGASLSSGARADQWQYTGGNHQQWTFTDLGGGYHRIVNVKSGLALTRASNGTVVQSAYTGSNDQQWSVASITDGWSSIINRGANQSLDVPNNQPMDGNFLSTYSYNAGPNQTFFLVAPGSWGTGNVTVNPGGNIQAAVDQVGRVGGGTVNLAAGTHNLGAGIQIKMRSNVRLRGAGVNSTTLSSNFQNGSGSVIECAHFGGLLSPTLENFTFNGNNSQGNGIGIGADSGREIVGLTIRDMNIRNFPGNGINCSLNNNFLIQNVELRNCGTSNLHGMYNRVVNNFTMRNVRAYDSRGGCGFKITGGSNWLIEDCISVNSLFDGIAIQDTPDRVTIRNSVFDNNGRGCNIGVTNLNMSSCTFNHNGEQGLYNPGGSGTISNCTATGNVGRNYDIYGATLVNCADGTYNGRYQLRPLNSGKAVEVANSSVSDGARVAQWTYSGGNHQKWDVAQQGSGQYRLLNVNSGKAMEVPGSSTADGAAVQQRTYGGGNNQKWAIVNVGNGLYRFAAVHSGKVLDIFAGSTADGANVVQWPYSGGSNQQFYMIPR